MSERNKELVRRLFVETDRRQGKLPVNIIADDFEAHIVGSPSVGLEVFQQSMEMYYTAFSDFDYTFEDMVAEGDRVAVRVAIQATHTGEFMGVPASGKPVSLVDCGIARIAGGKIAEWWNSPDRLGLMEQLGLITPSG